MKCKTMIILILLFLNLTSFIALSSQPDSSESIVMVTRIENIMKTRILNYFLKDIKRDLRNISYSSENTNDSVEYQKEINDIFLWSNINKNDIELHTIENKDYLDCFQNFRLFICYHIETIYKRDSTDDEVYYNSFIPSSDIYYISITDDYQFYILNDKENPELDLFIKEIFKVVKNEEQALCIAKLIMIVKKFRNNGFNYNSLGKFQKNNKTYYEYEIWKEEYGKIKKRILDIYEDCTFEIKKLN